MSDEIECPYCFEVCMVEDWEHMRQSKDYKQECEHCGKEFTWSWETIPKFETEKI